MLKRKLIFTKSITCISRFSTKTLDKTATVPSIAINVTNSDVSKLTFHKRPLPLSLVALSSPEGKILFREAMTQGGMESYFALSEQFITQSDPAFCSLSSLAMVLNALNFDPQRVWKGSWRWVSEEMLQCESKELCCHSIDKIRQHGMDFNGFESLARCHGVNIDSIRVTPEYANKPRSYDQFKQQIIDVSCNDKAQSFMVVNFSRQTLGQTGDGHFSPIGGYHKEKELVLILDVARFKYPPYWVSIQSLWQSMQGNDQCSGKSRGYFNISIATNKESATEVSLTKAESLAATRAASIAAAIARGEVRESIPPSLLTLTESITSKSSSFPSFSEPSYASVPLNASSSSCTKADTGLLASASCSSQQSSSSFKSSSHSNNNNSLQNNSSMSSNGSSNNNNSSSSQNLYTTSKLIISGCCNNSSAENNMNNVNSNSNMLSRLMKRTNSNMYNNNHTNNNTDMTTPVLSTTATTAASSNQDKVKLCSNPSNCSQRMSNNDNNYNDNNDEDFNKLIQICSC